MVRSAHDGTFRAVKTYANLAKRRISTARWFLGGLKSSKWVGSLAQSNQVETGTVERLRLILDYLDYLLTRKVFWKGISVIV